ncbi:MAG: UvrD-helicase domain-containing protein, partial [Sphaerochaeta sp.]|nr:UvrD-helicase domain-containing protein [Sphaerochaeta sp.]
MAVDIFTKEQFEAALPVHKQTGVPLWRHEGVVQGEHVYVLPVTNTNKRIVVRSSVPANGTSRPAGEDSIRHRVEYYWKGTWRQGGKGSKEYTTRVPGWPERLKDALTELWKAAVVDSKAHHAYGPQYDAYALLEQQQTQQEQPADINPDLTEPTNPVKPDPAEQTPDPTPEPEAEPTADPTPELATESSAEEAAPTLLETFLAAAAQEAALAAAEAVVVDGRTPNPAQQAAIEANVTHALRILAPPGAGKTFVLARRYAHLLSTGATPEGIFAVTFSKSMADELQERIVRVCPMIAENQQARDQICTIHALCWRILKAEGDQRRVPGPNGPVKNWQVKQAVEEFIEKIFHPSGQPSWKEALAYIDEVKALGLEPGEDMRFYGGVRDTDGRAVGRELHELRAAFDDWCRKNRVVTFADMLYDVEQRLLHDRAFRERWQARVHDLMVDEGQDTTGQAMRILTKLAAPQGRLTIVGDTDQLLYRFAGATPEANLYDGFEAQYSAGGTVMLSVNYRSTRTIINACSRLIQNNYRVDEARAGAPYDARYMKAVAARDDAPEGAPLDFTLYPDAASEAAAVVMRIEQEVNAELRNPEDYFVAGRTRAQLGYLEGPLVQSGIPYVNLAGSSFFGMKAIKDVLAYLRLAYDENSEAFERVYNIASATNAHPWGARKGEYCPHRYLGAAFVQACFDGNTGKPEYKWRWRAVQKRNSFRPGVEDLDTFVARLQERFKSDSLPELIDFVMQECYEPHLRATEGFIEDGDGGIFEDVETLKELAGRFDNPKDFFEHVDTAEKAAAAARDGDWSGRVG